MVPSLSDFKCKNAPQQTGSTQLNFLFLVLAAFMRHRLWPGFMLFQCISRCICFGAEHWQYCLTSADGSQVWTQRTAKFVVSNCWDIFLLFMWSFYVSQCPSVSVSCFFFHLFLFTSQLRLLGILGVFVFLFFFSLFKQLNTQSVDPIRDVWWHKHDIMQAIYIGMDRLST